MKEKEKGDVVSTQARVNNEYAIKGKKQIKVDELKPHPRNSEIYGEETDVSDLVVSIKESGKIEDPLVVNTNNIIISGDRRCLAAKKLQFETVPCEIREYKSEEAELEALINFNISRDKTNEQKTREGMELEKIFSLRAADRKITTLKQNRPDMGISPISGDLLNEDEKGVTRDLVARAVKISSGSKYERSKRVVEKADQYKREGKDKYSELLITLLNKSPSAAYELIKGNVDLSEEDIENLKTGKVSVRSLLPKKEPTHQESAENSVVIIVKSHINTIKTAVKELCDPSHIFIPKKRTEMMNKELESIVRDLQKLLKTEPSKTSAEVGVKNVTG